MTSRKHLGIFERLFSKPPLTPAIGTAILLAFILAIFGLAAYYVNELDRFLLDFPTISIVTGILILLYGESKQGIQIRASAEEICKSFKVKPDDRNDFLDAVFNDKLRVISGVILIPFFVVMYQSFGFWYESPLLLMIGQFYAGFIGFIVGELALAAFYFITKSRVLVRKIADQVNVLDRGQLKALRFLSSTSLRNFFIGSVAGFIVLLGLLAAPWRTGLPATEIALAVLLVLFLFLFGALAIPISSIHESMDDAKETMELRLSEMAKDADNIAKKALNTKPGDFSEVQRLQLLLEAISVFDSRVQAYPVWPFNFKQVVGALGSLGLVILESALVVWLSSGIT